MIELDEILDMIRIQLGELMNNDYDFYKDYKVLLSSEQQFVKIKDREKGAIYIVVKFLPATINFGQTLLPITINAVAEQNKQDVCQKLLIEFAETYNLTTASEGRIKQAYTTPSNLSNFNEIFSGFRSLMYMSGTLLISENSNPATLLISETKEELPCISFSSSFDVQLDSQVFYNSNNFSKSVGKVGTYTINIATYIVNTDFMNKVLNVALKNLTAEPNGVDTTFYFDIVYKNGMKIENCAFKLANVSTQQNIGELPMATLTFTN